MSQVERIFIGLSMIVLAGAFTYGMFMTVDAWITLETIKAQGALGQAAQAQEYNRAADSLRLYSVLTGVTLIGEIGIGFGYLGVVLGDLSS